MVNVKNKRCTHRGGCAKVPSYGKAGGKAEFCCGHAEAGMVLVTHKRCTHHGCTKQSSHGKAGGKPEYCPNHAKGGMASLKNKKCAHLGCTKHASYGKAGNKAQYCRDHAAEEMVNVKKKICTHHDCTTQLSFGKAGGKAEYCRQHAEDGMVCVVRKSCAHHGCTKRSSYGTVGNKAEFCREHAEDGMVNVVSKLCAFAGCTIMASYGEENTGTLKFCVRHAEEGMVSLSGPSRRDTISVGTDDAGTRGSDTPSRAGSGRRGKSRARSPTPAEPSSERSRETTKRARRSAGGGDLHPVRVKREGADNKVPHDEQARSCPGTENVVKTEDLEVSCKAEPAEAADETGSARKKRRRTKGGQPRGS